VDELWKTARTLLESGRIAEAVASYDEALAAAAECGSQELRDAVFSGRAAALAEVGRGDEVLTELHAILLRSKRRSTRLRAAYTSAGIYELRGDASRARRYALRARALGEGEPAGSRALVESLLGNLLAADSRFAEAEAAYTRALELDPGAPEYFRMVDLENIGYCKAASGRVADGLVLLHRALTFFRSNDIPECEVTALTEVCHAL
jgi:tetratricopeptide (TPR) repeat protein